MPYKFNVGPKTHTPLPLAVAVQEKPKEREKVYTLKQSDIDRIRDNGRKEGVAVAWRVMLAIPVSALHDSFGFEKEQLLKFLDAALYKYDSYERGYLELKDLEQMLDDECGIKLEPLSNTRHVV